jgi:hypothetical protein
VLTTAIAAKTDNVKALFGIKLSTATADSRRISCIVSDATALPVRRSFKKTLFYNNAYSEEHSKYKAKEVNFQYLPIWKCFPLIVNER